MIFGKSDGVGEEEEDGPAISSLEPYGIANRATLHHRVVLITPTRRADVKFK